MKEVMKTLKWAGLFVSVLFIPAYATFGRHKESKTDEKKEDE